MKIRKGDQVKIVSGNDKGKQGRVILVSPMDGRIKIEGLNMHKKHLRPRTQGKKGEIVSVPSALPISRVMLVCPKCSNAVRVGFSVNDTGEKIRVCKKCLAEV